MGVGDMWEVPQLRRIKEAQALASKTENPGSLCKLVAILRNEFEIRNTPPLVLECVEERTSAVDGKLKLIHP